MKISALKKMINEAVRTAIREELQLQSRGPVAEAAQSTQKPSTQLLREHFTKRRSTVGEAYDGLAGSEPAQVVSHGSKIAPKNPKTVLKTGEKYASGVGILEWFNKEKETEVLGNHRQAIDKMKKTDAIVGQIFNKARK